MQTSLLPLQRSARGVAARAQRLRALYDDTSADVEALDRALREIALCALRIDRGGRVRRAKRPATGSLRSRARLTSAS